jgi:hypothetical protein
MEGLVNGFSAAVANFAYKTILFLRKNGSKIG